MRYMLFSIVIILFGFASLVILHETVHVEIYRSYGIESHVEYFSQIPYAVTIAQEGCPNETCILAHNLNDVIGYHLQAILVAICLLLFVIIILLELIFKSDLAKLNTTF